MSNTKNALPLNRDVKQNMIIFTILIIIIAVFSIMNPTFLSYDNFHSILLTSIPVALIAIGECICIIGGYFDMSVGMVASFGGLFAATMMKLGQPVPVAVLVGITVGLSSGLIAGLSVSRLRMNAFITTFALQQIYRGLIFIWTEGLPRPLMGPEYIPFTNIGQTKIFNGSLQLPILIMLFIYILMALFMKYNRIGRSIYLIGNNAKAAHICGIRNKNIQLFMFMATGALAAVAGMLLAMRTGTSQPFVGEMYAMEAIAATIVGGTSMAGGKGNLGMTLVGVIIVYIIKNGLIMIGLDDFYQYIAVGLILFIAVLAQVQKTKR
jgi:ribose transport system permease protein